MDKWSLCQECKVGLTLKKKNQVNVVYNVNKNFQKELYDHFNRYRKRCNLLINIHDKPLQITN